MHILWLPPKIRIQLAWDGIQECMCTATSSQVTLWQVLPAPGAMEKQP